MNHRLCTGYARGKVSLQSLVTGETLPGVVHVGAVCLDRTEPTEDLTASEAGQLAVGADEQFAEVAFQLAGQFELTAAAGAVFLLWCGASDRRARCQ